MLTPIGRHGGLPLDQRSSRTRRQDAARALDTGVWSPAGIRLRHHAARTRALAQQVREAKPIDGMRAWFRSFFSVLRVRSGARHFSLRTLLYRPSSPLRVFSTVGKTAAGGSGAPRSGSVRRPRRTSTTSTGWFAFAMQ